MSVMLVLVNYYSTISLCSSGPLNLPPEPYYEHVVSLAAGHVHMGADLLMLNVIQPLLRSGNRAGTTTTDVLKQRYKDLYGRDISRDTLVQVEQIHSNKKVSGPLLLYTSRTDCHYCKYFR